RVVPVLHRKETAVRWSVLTLLLATGLGLMPVRGGWAEPKVERPVVSPTGSAKKVKILAEGEWTHLPVYTAATLLREQRQWVLRTREQLIQAAGPHALPLLAKALGVKALDFDKHMVLAVFDGTQPMVGVSGGGPPSALYRVAITAMVLDGPGKIMTVQ